MICKLYFIVINKALKVFQICIRVLQSQPTEQVLRSSNRKKMETPAWSTSQEIGSQKGIWDTGPRGGVTVPTAPGQQLN